MLTKTQDAGSVTIIKIYLEHAFGLPNNVSYLFVVKCLKVKRHVSVLLRLINL